jgi:succinate dehydrogenase / fumarate reductase membrane anchor subunit
MAGNRDLPDKTLHVDVLRSQLKRVRGLGSARSGSGAWWAERLTSIALVPLTLWFIVSVISLEGTTRTGMIAWLHAPVPLVLVLCLVVATFWHTEQGLRVVIDDYVRNDTTRIAMLLLSRGICIVAALLCVVSALRLRLWEGKG